MPASLPLFSRGLKLVRLGVIVMLLQIVTAFVVGVMAALADTPDEGRDALMYFKYVMLANVVAVGMMAVGVCRALPELARARMDLRTMLVSAAGFIVATSALVWSYYMMSSFLDALVAYFDAINGADSFERLAAREAEFEAATSRFESATTIVAVKDLAYGAGLYFLIRTVQASAAINDQLALRDRAGSMHRTLLVMILADLFYQLTYANAGGGGKGALIIAVYWVFCHLKLQRFLFDAAWFVNEPHNLPTATVVVRSEGGAAAARPSEAALGRASRPSMPQSGAAPARPSTANVAADAPAPRPSQPAPIIIVPPPPTAPTPRAASAAEGEPDGNGPRFLR